MSSNPTMPLRLKAENLSCERGGRLVFKDISFAIFAGELAELRGPNGAGKSSLLRLLAGLNTSLSGSLILEGGATETTLAEQSHYIGHAEANKPALTVRENVVFWQKFLGGNVNANLFSAFNLEALADDQALLLSAGQKRRLALTRLVVAHRPLWLLDEPTVGLDAASLVILQNHIRDHLKNGGIVIAATHAELGVKSARVIQLGKAT
jgi:heme exporter protein A